MSATARVLPCAYEARHARIVEQLHDIPAVMHELSVRGFVVTEIILGQQHPVVNVQHTPACDTVPAVWRRVERTPLGRITTWVWLLNGVQVEWVTIAARTH
jgi:hypothetical protein